jgi:hypothetical protein
MHDVRVLRNDLTNPGIRANVDKVFAHPSFNQPTNDVRDQIQAQASALSQAWIMRRMPVVRKVNR